MPPSTLGYWGKPTATLDWCENNYEVTKYIAEFWNTVSNLAMIGPGFAGLYYAYKNGLERRMMLCFISLAMVGFGSWHFHMTLLYEMQLFDELPMLWGSLLLVYALVTHIYSVTEQNHLYNNLLKISLAFYGVASTVIYLHFKTPILFQAAYGTLVTGMAYLDVCILKEKPCNKKLLYGSIACYYGGFILWIIDNLHCSSLDLVRKEILPPYLAPFTQLHAWWHCLAGYGAYLHIVFCAHSRNESQARHIPLRFVWHTGVVIDDDSDDQAKAKLKAS